MTRPLKPPKHWAPPPTDETEFTPGAQRGWHAWDAWSPEYEFCHFVGWLQRMLAPAVVLETGVGVGNLTRFLDLAACQYWGFESDPEWRIIRQGGIVYRTEHAPSAYDMQQADFVILDSAVELRSWEIDLWALHGKPGSVCIVHDAARRHPLIRAAAERASASQVNGSRIGGVFLANPRGGWLAVHP